MVVNTLHILVVKAAAKLLAAIQEQVCQTPSYSTIESWSQQSEVTTDPSEEETDKKVAHCFNINIIKSETTEINISKQAPLFIFWCLCALITLSSQKLLISNPCSCLS